MKHGYKDTNNRAKFQIYLRISEREYLRAKLKDSVNQEKIKVLDFAYTAYTNVQTFDIQLIAQCMHEFHKCMQISISEEKLRIICKSSDFLVTLHYV